MAVKVISASDTVVLAFACVADCVSGIVVVVVVIVVVVFSMVSGSRVDIVVVVVLGCC